ncbi:HNH endonuclease [Dehalobacter sp. DCM]|uniref:HNH endonuclease n=1 Tax=Dehalobacter sp. DCM TaxID=2907827 RepID=UPI003FCD918F
MQISGLPGTDGRPVLPKTQPIDRRKKQDETNWQPLCIKCHNRKTKTKDQYRE